MSKLKYLILLLAIPVFIACAPRTGGTKSKSGAINEDLSRYRPSFERPVAEEPATVEERSIDTQAYKPEHDVTVSLNTVLDSLEQKNIDYKVVQGYTIQVYSGNSREAANEAKSMVYKLFPDSRPETTYVQPNYKVKVGKYLTRTEAQNLFAKLKNDFPGALVIPEKINLARY